MITDRTGPSGLRSSAGDVGGLGSKIEGSATELVLDPVCIDGSSGLDIGVSKGPAESLRWLYGCDGMDNPSGNEGIGGGGVWLY